MTEGADITTTDYAGKSIYRNNTLQFIFQPKNYVELDGMDCYDYGARLYDAALGRFFVQDRFAEKYESMTPYQYVANNPILNIDINGDSIIVLNAPKGAHRAGHMAMLIQNKSGTWSLWSKNGTQDNGGLSGENNSDEGDQAGVGEFDSPEAFMESSANTVIDEETGEREYSEGYLIATTPDEDRDAEGGARSVLDENYNVLESSCSTMVQSALQEAGKQDGSPSTLSSVTAATVGAAIGGGKGSALANIINKKTPRIIYERIKNQNKGKVIK